ncbi:MAG: TrkA family potassium uptake protein [Parvularcula sp.]|jgi:trk system potassium uptake protein TrkA|nr:TrkA family potassium uptake protein [Parvularcula sp.]
MPKRRSVAVIGLGTFGATVARRLSEYGDHILGIDISEAKVSELVSALDRAVIADAVEEKAMIEAGVGECDLCVVAVASDLEVSILAVMNVRKAGVKEIWAKADSETHVQILEKLGVDRVLRPETAFGEVVAQEIHNPLMRGSVKIGGDILLAQIKAPDDVCGQMLRDMRLDSSHALRCIGILRGREFIDPSSDTEIIDGDRLLMIGDRRVMRDFVDRKRARA